MSFKRPRIFNGVDDDDGGDSKRRSSSIVASHDIHRSVFTQSDMEALRRGTEARNKLLNLLAYDLAATAFRIDTNTNRVARLTQEQWQDYILRCALATTKADYDSTVSLSKWANELLHGTTLEPGDPRQGVIARSNESLQNTIAQLSFYIDTLSDKFPFMKPGGTYDPRAKSMIPDSLEASGRLIREYTPGVAPVDPIRRAVSVAPAPAPPPRPAGSFIIRGTADEVYDATQSQHDSDDFVPGSPQGGDYYNREPSIPRALSSVAEAAPRFSATQSIGSAPPPPTPPRISSESTIPLSYNERTPTRSWLIAGSSTQPLASTFSAPRDDNGDGSQEARDFTYNRARAARELGARGVGSGSGPQPPPLEYEDGSRVLPRANAGNILRGIIGEPIPSTATEPNIGRDYGSRQSSFGSFREPARISRSVRDEPSRSESPELVVASPPRVPSVYERERKASSGLSSQWQGLLDDANYARRVTATPPSPIPTAGDYGDDDDDTLAPLPSRRRTRPKKSTPFVPGSQIVDLTNSESQISGKIKSRNESGAWIAAMARLRAT